MFKWKVSRLGSKKDRTKQKLNNESDTKENEEIYARNNNNSKDRSKDVTGSPSPKKFGLFATGGGSKSETNSGNTMTLSRVGQRLAVPHPASNGLALSNENLLSEIPPPLPPLKPEWRNHMRLAEQQQEEAIPSDSLYSVHRKDSRSLEPRPPLRKPESRIHPANEPAESRILSETRGPADLAHWSSHGYLAKEPENLNDTGYVMLKRHQSDHRGQSTGLQQPDPGQPDPPHSPSKYFSVKGFQHLVQMHRPSETNEKYFSVDNSFLAGNPEMRNKIRQNIHPDQYRQSTDHQPDQLRRADLCPEYVKPPAPVKRTESANGPPPPLPPYQRPPPPKQPESSNLASSKQISGSVSWLEWTQQLQAYVAWVNSQLRKRPGLRPVKDLRTDLQTGEVLAQLIEIISGEELLGIQYSPESLQGMRENLERVLQFMSNKQIKMHNISSRELLEGNLKSVMRLILALAAHYKPQSVKHHDTSADSIEPKKSEDSILSRREYKPEDSLISRREYKPEDSLPARREYKTDLQDRLTRDQDPGENLRSRKRGGADGPKTSVETQTFELRSTGPSSPQASRPSTHSPPVSRQSAAPSPQICRQAATQSPPAVNRSATETPPTSRSNGPSPISRGLTNEGFVRSGSGRKLPQIPERARSNTLPTRRHEEDEDGEDAEDGSKNKNKPKALEFWESMENIERNDFRYNTIHRMSVGRRMLPKPPESSSHSRSQSIDREDKGSLNSSFSGPSSLPIGSVPQSPHVLHKIPPDGASLQSENSDLEQRQHGEGSSDKNSPPTSVVLGQGEQLSSGQNKANPAFDWIQGSFEASVVKKWSLANQSFGEMEAASKERNIPYSVLLQELNQAKQQLQELYNLLLTNRTPDRDLKQELSEKNIGLEAVGSLKGFLRSSLERKLEAVGGEATKASGDFDEELQVAREAIASLRSMFRESDPGHHILDTLEQCVTVIVEKAGSTGPAPDAAEDGPEAGPGSPQPPSTKIIYFMPRSATPFMTSVNRPVGKVTLRDFKAVFDRPGFFRYHIKNTDTEYGMVKEEIAEDDRVLPGNSGKIVLWVEEE